MFIFDGKTRADAKEVELKEQLSVLRSTNPTLKIKIAAILFAEDAGSVLYTRLKQEAAERVGIEYSISTFSIKTGVEQVMAHLQQLNQDPTVTGIIIQKPWRKTWQSASMVEGDPKDIRQVFSAWWILLTSQIALEKDVDGLHPKTLAAIATGTWQDEARVMPATAKAVFDILRVAAHQVGEVREGSDQAFWSWLQTQKVAVIGKSDLLGQPVFYELKNHLVAVELLGSNELKRKMEQGKALREFSIVISATGQKNLITGELLGDQVILVDVGEPQPDIDANSVANHARFLTPVPGGVGPLTVISLLENAVALVQ
jgi:methylenetetrahydrofolate dehydrogenase (NADP+)/methenyltetrahydrofolate cyclohydrolase